MKKRLNEEFEDEFIDDEEILDDDEEFLDDDEILDDEDFEDEDFDDDDFDDEPKKKKGKKLDKKGSKKKGKLSKGAKIGISIGSAVVGIAAIALIVVFVVMPLLVPKATIDSDFEALLSVNGYQNYEASKTAELKSDATYSKIYSVDDMLKSGEVDKNNKAEFAAALYSLAISNYNNVKGSGWYCYTDSSVFATDVTATLGISLTFPTFNVGVRAAYCLGYVEADAPNAAQKKAKQNNYFSQTISGVSKLDIEGLPSNLTGTLKGMFGYNCIEFLNNGTYAYKRGVNGGAQFYGAKKDVAYKYLMGAYNKKLYEETYKKKAKDPVSGYPEKTFITDAYKDTYAEAKSLDYVETPKDIIQRNSPWGKLDTLYDNAYKLKPFDEEYTYYIGTYGTGWAVYDFSKENIDGSKTTVTYDKNTHIYTIEMAVKEDKADAACMFAKGSLTKDTKDYIQLQNAKYALTKNTIKIFDNGLIASWEREETVSSEDPAKLTILTGECKKGGGTTNHTYMSFSYSPIDYSPLALAARYLPEMGTLTNEKYKQDLSGWPTLDEYNPKEKDYTTLK